MSSSRRKTVQAHTLELHEGNAFPPEAWLRAMMVRRHRHFIAETLAALEQVRDLIQRLKDDEEEEREPWKNHKD
jgi:hypothetical protein